MSFTRQLVSVVAAFSSAQTGTVIHVDDDNCPGPGDGSEADPFCLIQDAIDAAVDGAEIVVAPGTYFETINFLGKAITLRSSDGPEVTVIDGGGVGAGSVVTCGSGEGPGSVLEGLTITGGLALAGGGMLNDGTSPTVIGCVFSTNVVDGLGFGGGMYNENGSPTVIHCTFDGNFAVRFPNGGAKGGGMYNKDSSPTVIACKFRQNVALFSFSTGGGMYNDNSSPLLVNCLFEANSGGDAGGMMNYNSRAIVTNCTFTGNSWRGIVNYWNSDSVLTNCVLWSNFGDEQIIDWSSSSTVSYSTVQGGWSGAGSNNIDADPLFVRASNCCAASHGPGCDDPVCEVVVCDVEPYCCEYWDYVCADLAATLCPACPNDYGLLPGSPCIDAGDNDAVPGGINTDLDGNPRFLDVPETPDAGNGDPPLVDMGAYESLGGGCLALTSQETVCHPDGSTFTLNVEGVSACTGDTAMATFTGSGGAVGEDLCFTIMVNGQQGGFCCASQVCVPVPDCSEAVADLDGDGFVGVMDLMLLLSQLGPCSGSCWADMDHDGMVGVTDLLIVLANWGACN